MKNLRILLFLLSLATIAQAQHEHHATTTADTAKNAKKPLSPRQTAMAMVGNNHVHIDYGSPSVRGRQIWNGLVAFGQVWATGAHKATWVEFGQDVKIDGQLVPKGKYGFFTIPDKKTWTLILNKSWNMHLADAYKQDDDIVRIKVKPKKNKNITEALTYEVIAINDNNGKVKMSWEYLNVSFDFENLGK